jgi:hypothetical protein
MKIDASTCHKFGFRVSGIEVYNSKNDEKVFKNKYFGRQLQDDDVTPSIALFFHNGNKYYHFISKVSFIIGTQLRTNVIEYFKKQTEEFIKVMEKTASHRFYSASLLLVYDGKQADRLLRTEGAQ